MVSGSPTAGGVAGYFRNGTSATATNPITCHQQGGAAGREPTESADDGGGGERGEAAERRPDDAMPVSRPKLFWLSREISTMPASAARRFGILGRDSRRPSGARRRLLERDGVFDLRLAEGEGHDERDEAGDQAGERGRGSGTRPG